MLHSCTRSATAKDHGNRPRNTLAAVVLGAQLAIGTMVLPAPASAQQSAPQLYEEALLRYNQNDMEGTLLGLKQTLQEDPNLLAAHILLARVFISLREGAAAEHSLIKAQQLGADANVTWPLRARSMLQQHKFKALLALTPQEGLAPEPQAQVLVSRARAHLELGQYAEAERTFIAARELAPQDAEPRVGLATVAFRKHDLYTAEARALAAVRVAPDSAAAWNARASIAHTLGQIKNAIEWYGRSLELQPTHQESRVSRAGALLDVGRTEDAGRDIAYLREYFPLDPRTAYLNSVYLAKVGRKVQAEEALRRAAALLEDMGPVLVGRAPQLQMLAGIANFELKKYEQAKTYLNQFLDAYPRDPGARKILGTILVEQKRYQEAIQTLEPILDSASGDPRVLSLLATAYAEQRRFDIATTYLEKAIELGGGTSALRTRLAVSRMGAGEVRRGMQELEELFEADPVRNSQAGASLLVAHLKRGDAKSAQAVGLRLVKAAPQSVVALNLLGSAQLAAGRTEDAQISYERALSLEPEFVPARINLGKLAARAGRTEEARQRFEELLAEDDTQIAVLLELARLEAAVGRLAQAERWLNKARDADPESVATRLALVDLHLTRDEPEEALRLAKEAQWRAPEDLEVQAAIGRCHLAMGREDLARTVYAGMARTAGFDPGKLYGVAELQIAVGAMKDAAYTLSKAMNADPGHVRVRMLLTETLVRIGKPEEAMELAQDLQKEVPSLVAVHGLAADVQLALGRLEDARASYEHALRLAPDSRIAVRLYQVRVRLGETAEATQFLEEWVAGHPDDRLALRALAESRLASGDYAASKLLYQQLLKLEPDSPGVLNNLAHVLDRLGEPGAIELARRARSLAPGDPVISDTLGWLLVRAGEPEEGLAHLRDAQARAAGHPEIRFHIAVALSSLGREDEARRELEAALAANTHFNGAEEARALFERLNK